MRNNRAKKNTTQRILLRKKKIPFWHGNNNTWNFPGNSLFERNKMVDKSWINTHQASFVCKENKSYLSKDSFLINLNHACVYSWLATRQDVWTLYSWQFSCYFFYINICIYLFYILYLCFSGNRWLKKGLYRFHSNRSVSLFVYNMPQFLYF